MTTENKHSERPMLEWNDELVSKFWNFWSQYPEQYFTFQFGHQIADRLKRFLKEKKQILDYGCGNGYLLEHLLSIDADVSGIDFSEKSVQEVNRRLSGRLHFKGVQLHTEIKNLSNKFDALVAIEVIEHLNDSYLHQMMDDIRNLLTADGIAIITTPNDEDLEASQVYCPVSNKVFHRWQHVRSWSEQSLRAFTTREGFEVVQVFTTDFSILPKASLKQAARKTFRFLTHAKQPHLVCILRKK